MRPLRGTRTPRSPRGSDPGEAVAIKNPYGVGDSGPQARPIKITCACCHLPYTIVAGPKTPIPRSACRACSMHELAGDSDKQVIAYQDHAQRARQLMEKAYELLRDGMAERDAALAERKRFGQMLYEANEDR